MVLKCSIALALSRPDHFLPTPAHVAHEEDNAALQHISQTVKKAADDNNRHQVTREVAGLQDTLLC
eukprot:722213-Amphidinium_carterae.3